MTDHAYDPQTPVSKTDCDNVAAHIFEYLDSEMTEQDATDMRNHVAECMPCLAELSIDEMIKRVLKRSCAEQAPENLRVRIRAQFTTVTFES